MALRIESLAEELAKPEDVRLREVVAALDGRAVIFDGLGSRVEHLLAEMDYWIARAGDAERLADERLAHANQLQADIEAEMQGRLALRKRLGARENETMGAFLSDDCLGCRVLAGTEPIGRVPSCIDDQAMLLARNGKSPHEIAHVMMIWANEASERAIVWADKEDSIAMHQAAEAAHDLIHGTTYERDDERDG